MTWHPSPAVVEAELADLDASTDWESIDWTFDPVVVEVTAPPAEKPSKFAMWFARIFWALIFLMLAEDLRLFWWAWVLGR